MPHAGDEQFWERMNSRDVRLDTPGMSNIERPPNTASYDVLVATAAGKPLYHYGHRPRRDDAVRPFEQLVALSAACVAFVHATRGAVRTVTLRQGTAFFGRFHDIYVVASTTERNAPEDLLRTLAVTAVTAVYFLVSATFAAVLARRPGLDLGRRTDEVGVTAARIVRRALLYPMSLDAVLMQPNSHAPHALRRLGAVLASAQRQRRVVSHMIVFTACPPFPHRVLASASPVYHKLTPRDLFLISALLPLNVKEHPMLPERVYLQAYSYGRASLLTVRLVEPRLVDAKSFMDSVGGDSWRPQWCADGGADSVWVVSVADLSLGTMEECRILGEAAVSEVEKKIDRSTLAKDMWVWMERPFKASDVYEGVLGIVAVREELLVATAGMLDYEFVLEAKKIRRVDDDSRRWFCRRSELLDCWIVANEDTIVFVREMESLEQCVEVCDAHVLPWLNANHRILFSKKSMVALPPNTPLSFLLTPFES